MTSDSATAANVSAAPSPMPAIVSVSQCASMTTRDAATISGQNAARQPDAHSTVGARQVGMPSL